MASGPPASTKAPLATLRGAPSTTAVTLTVLPSAPVRTIGTLRASAGAAFQSTETSSRVSPLAAAGPGATFSQGSPALAVKARARRPG